MKALIVALSMLSAVVVDSLWAQDIYADIAVSQGGTSLGTIRVRLDYDKAPRVCANFIGLATGRKAWLNTTTGRVEVGKKFYDGLTFHRLIHNFMIQGGDPAGNGSGGPGYAFQDEFDPSLRHDAAYKISMANSGPHSNGSQFFILFGAATFLDDKHSVFGEVINDATHPNGTAIIDGFTNDTSFPTGANDLPDTPITIDSVLITGPGVAGFDIFDPALNLTTVNGVNTAISYNGGTSTYSITMDRANQIEYFLQLSNNLESWFFASNGVTSFPYLLSMDNETDWTLNLTGVSGNMFYSRVAQIDYSVVPRAPQNLTANGSTLELPMGSETVTLTFDGAGAGTWSYSGGGSGNLTSVNWTRDNNQVSGALFYGSAQGRFIPVGRLNVTFDSPVGSENWQSLDFSSLNSLVGINRYVNFHTGTTGWVDGTVTVPGPGGIGTAAEVLRVPFVYVP